MGNSQDIANVKNSFSDIKHVKMSLRSRLSEETSDQALLVSIGGSECLEERELQKIEDHRNEQKDLKISVLIALHTYTSSTIQNQLFIACVIKKC